MTQVLTKTAVAEFWGGAADGQMAEVPYPGPSVLERAGDTYRLYRSWPWFNTRLARYVIVRDK